MNKIKKGDKLTIANIKYKDGKLVKCKKGKETVFTIGGVFVGKKYE